MNNYGEDIIGECWVCGKKWERREYKKWFYFNPFGGGEPFVVCLRHPGAYDFARAAELLAQEAINYLGIK